MYFGLVHYPEIDHQGFQSFRKEYDPYSHVFREHVTFIFPVPESIGQQHLEGHIATVLSRWKPFDVHFCTIEKTWDHWIYMGAKEGHDRVVQLHDEFYQGILRPYLREDLPFDPHIGLGLFSKEAYDFNHPTAPLTLDEEKYEQAFREIKGMGLDVWLTIDRLSLVKINTRFSECIEVRDFSL